MNDPQRIHRASDMLNGLDLFSGIGGITIALKEWVRPIAYCESDRYCQSVLLSRMRDGSLPRAPIWDDVTSLDSSMFSPREADIVYGGFPCQDLSVAGTGKGLEGERSGLFFEIIRLASELRPRFVFLENVPAISVRGLERVCLEFTALGYDCRWTIVSAAELGAPHLRERWFLLAHSNNKRGWKKQISQRWGQDKAKSWHDGKKEPVANSTGKRFKEKGQSETRQIASPGWWSSEPDVGRVVDELPFRMDRIKALGNAVVPGQAREAFRRLIGL